ncbi:MAG: 3-deoxy-8-phosphooctulonate synthase, partial [Firmicutes bacterium]|nr:3-deoxy-8-phosphooctulonate synthase [Bacillota bacterium]
MGYFINELFGEKLLLIAGPCVIESEEHVMMMAGELKDISDRVGVKLVFKASFDKANRTSVSS